ncbi:MAG: AlpA family phage regulatory protein [Rhodoferax sp.]|nr:AlpA family phage regulatory protein [Rhodoferax sp.]
MENMKAKGSKSMNRLIMCIGGSDSEYSHTDHALKAFGFRREWTTTPLVPSLAITNDMPESGGGGGESAATPEVAAADDDDGGDADSDPDRRPRQFQITPALFTFAVLERYVSLNRTRIYDLIRQGKFPPPLKIGKSSRWQRSAIDGWIAAQARSTTAQR